MDPDAIEHGVVLTDRLRAQLLLQPEREAHRRRRMGEEKQEGIAAGARLDCVGGLGQEFAYLAVVGLDALDPGVFPSACFSRVDPTMSVKTRVTRCCPLGGQAAA
ncbi:MAG: hypothetical protein M5U12_14550 [Verrucomicrobia bacterium]|nr:hypothetical protein [Verrucomicrobiota bacterium]